jgi:hypothetical protein
MSSKRRSLRDFHQCRMNVIQVTRVTGEAMVKIMVCTNLSNDTNDHNPDIQCIAIIGSIPLLVDY